MIDFASREMNGKKIEFPKQKKITIRSYKNFDKEAFKEDIKRIDLEQMEKMGVDEAVDFFTNSVKASLDSHAPFITFTPSYKFNPVISEETKKKIDERNIAHKKAKLTKAPEDIKEYKKLRNKCVGLTRKDMREAVESEMNSNSASAWRALNMLRRKEQSKNDPPTKLLIEDKVVTDPLKIATTMNEFFTNKILKLQEQMATNEPTEDPIEHMKKHLPEDISELDWELVSQNEVVEAIRQAKNGRSSGPDGISNWILKVAPNEFAASLTLLYNKSISTATFPSAWKHATVIPLWKKNSKLEPSSYRPVSLTCKSSILFEKLIQRRLSEHLRKENLHCPDQDGYQQGKSTTTLTCRAYDRWCRAANSGMYAGVLAIDLSAAFDLIGGKDGALLAQKAKAMGASEQTTKWLLSYFY